MAPQSNNGHNKNSDSNSYSTPDELVTSTGAKIRLVGLNPARLQRLQSAGKEPPKPFRLIPNDLGDSQKEELTEKDLQTLEEKEEWRKYKEELAEIENKRNENVMKYVFSDGFQIDDAGMEQWKKEEVEDYGLELSESAIQLRMDFINAKVIGNIDDLSNIMAGVMERTGVPAEMLGEVRNSFRRTVQQDAPGEASTA